MAFFNRYTSAPSLLNAGDNTYIIVGLRAPSDEEGGGDDEEEEECTEEQDDTLLSSGDLTERLRCNSESTVDADRGSTSGESMDPGLLNVSHNETLTMSESDASPMVTHRTWKKKRRAPLPPDMSPVVPFRHSYAFDSAAGIRLQTSTDTESVSSENVLFCQTSTDSDIPESARGSNFPGELAGVDNLHDLSHQRRNRGLNFVDNLHGTTPRSGQSQFLEVGGAYGRSVREKSTFKKIQEAIRSPQIRRKKSKVVRDKNLEDPKSQRSRKTKSEDPSRSPGLRKSLSFEPMPEMSDWIIAVVEDLIEVDQEFEVKRIPDYDRYLTGLLEETDPKHVDYEELAKAAKRVHSMVKTREDELQDSDNQAAMESIQERFPNDDLQLRNNNNNNNNTNTTNNNGAASNNNHRKSGESLDNSTLSNQSNDEKDKTPTKAKGVSTRRRSAPSAVLFKSFGGSRSKSTASLWSNAGMGKKDHDVINQFKITDTDSNRMFIMEGSVQLATAMQIQERYLFLFSDLLLVAKQKSSTAFKLKHRVQLCDMWIASCIEEVSETTRPPDRSFVLGWPTANVVATFPKAEQKDEWLRKLSERITSEKIKDEKRSLQLKVALRDIPGASSRGTCEMLINNETQAKDVLLECLRKLSIPENDAKDYQLWVLSGKEGSAYPLIGHETPFSIKLSQVRELTRSRSRDDLDKMTSGDPDTVVEDTSSNQKCEFYLKQKKSKKHSLDNAAYQKTTKKSKRSPNIINTLLRRFRPAQPLVFSLPLSQICDQDCDFDPPEPIIRLMVLVYNKGPHISGIMRKGNNAQLGKEIRAKIETGVRYTIEDHQAPTAASVFKEFLRCIPGSLLTNELHDQWAAFKKEDPEDVNIENIKRIAGQLPSAHYRLLKLTICLLQHLAKHSDKTNMGPTNLATCIAPSFCKPDLPNINTKTPMTAQKMQSSLLEITTVFTPLIALMIVKHVEIFGEDILNMFVKYGCEASPPVSLDTDKVDSGQLENHGDLEEEEELEEELMGEEEDDMEEDEMEDDEGFNHQRLQNQHRLQQKQQQLRQQQHIQRDSNSGTDSDSMHSVLSMPDTGMGYRRDDSSIDSLVDREYFPNEPESSPKASKSHLSPSNLSRDSGLTLSDTQLYDDEPCHGDTNANIVPASSRPYQRGASSFDNPDLDYHDPSLYGQILDARYFRRANNPVPPPRKRGSKKGRDSGEVSGEPVRPPFKHSMSATLLDLPDKHRKVGDLRPMLTHPPFGKRISSDSIGEEEETPSPRDSMDFQKMQKSMDIGTIVKSESGTHLFLGDETLPTKYNLSNKTGGARGFIRQSSVTDSTPPVSPQSRFSQSSRDSAISDFSMSRDGSIQSAPQTPDEPPSKPLKWTSEREEQSSFKPWDGRLAYSMNIRTSLPHSKSTSDLMERDLDDDDDDEDDDEDENEHSGSSCQRSNQTYTERHGYKPSSPKLWSGKSHEAEEVEMNRRPHFSLMIPSDSSSQQTKPSYNRQGLAHHLVKGSPPPNVILKSLQQQPPTRRESVPMKASYNSAIIEQVRRSSTDAMPFDVSKSMNSIRPEEYLTVASQPIMITSTASEDSASAANATRAKLSKYVSSNVDLSLTSKDKDKLLAESKRPDRPPNYQQALQRNFMIKHSIPIDITTDDTEKQKEISAKAKAVYEKSLKIYDEQRKSKSGDGCQSAKHKDMSFENSDSVISEEMESSSSYPSDSGSPMFGKDSQGAHLSHNAYSGFLDMGSISCSLQEDVLSKRNALSVDDIARNYPSSLNRNNSKLSDTGSSSGSSVTVSNLSRHSDSFGCQSDISSTSVVTVSSVASNDSAAEERAYNRTPRSSVDFDQRNMAYSRHFRPVDPDHSPSSNEGSPPYDEGGYVTLKKDPKQLYLESIKIYEEHPVPKADDVPSPACSKDIAQSSLQSSLHSQSSSLTSNPVTTAQQPLSDLSPPRGRPRVVSTLNVPTFGGVHRSTSDATEHVNKLGPYSPRSVKPSLGQAAFGGSFDSAAQPPVTRRAGQATGLGGKSTSSELSSDHHHKFLKAKSYFYQPEDDKLSSPRNFPCPPLSKIASSTPVTSIQPSSNIKSLNTSVSKVSVSFDSDFMNSPRRPENVSSAKIDKPKSKGPSLDSGAKPKKELPWSVKDLKSHFDKDSTPQSTSVPSGATSTTPRRRSPPPYQDPPPFRRLQDTARQSTSSTSSAGSDQGTSKFIPVKKSSSSHQRLGPQSNGHDMIGYWSSSEDGYSSSLERRSIRSNNSNPDLDSVMDKTKITYV